MANRALIEKEIREYCTLNDISDVSGFITQCILKGFNIFKYGLSPGDNIKRQNGEIIDNGSNRKRKKNNNITSEFNKTVTEDTESKGYSTVDVDKSTPVIVRRKRKITVSKLD